MAPSGKSVPSIVKKNVILLSISQALLGMVLQVQSVFAALTILLLSGSPTIAGLTSAFPWGGRLLVVYHTGRLMDRLGRVPVIVGGCVMAAASVTILGASVFLRSLLGFAIGPFLMGIGVGIAQQARIAVSDMFPAR